MDFWKNTAPYAERKRLEKALYDAGPSAPGSNGEAIKAAARKHLETLPKFKTKYRVVATLGDGTVSVDTLDDAGGAGDKAAFEMFHAGARHVSITPVEVPA